MREKEKWPGLSRRLLLAAVSLAGLMFLVFARPGGAIEVSSPASRGAKAVVRGRVESVRSSWDRSRRRIYTYTRIRVESELKGETPDYVTIRQVGGKVGRVRLIAVDEPLFAAGERVEVALSSESSETELAPGAGAKKHLGGSASELGRAGAASGYIWDGYKWVTSGLPMEYWVNASFSSTERDVLRSSFDTWENDPDSSMEYVYAGTTSRSGPAYDGLNVMTKGYTGGSIATTYFWVDDVTLDMLEVDIVYDYVSWSWSTSGEAGKFDLQNIATHENGHTLVLSDLYPSSPGYQDSDREQTMWGYAAPGETKKRTLEWGDLAGVAALYPTLGPPNVTNVSAVPGEGQIRLSWANPSVPGFSGVLVVRKEGSAPAATTDGTQIYSGSGTTWTDSGLTNGKTYCYRIFSEDGSGRFSSGVTVSAVPRHASALTVAATPATITWGSPATIESVLSPALTPAPSVTLLSSENGSGWSGVADMSWGGESYRAIVSPPALTYYRSSWPGNASYAGAASPSVLVRVRPKLATGLSATALRYGQTMRVSGYVYPRHDGAKAGFYWERYWGGGIWRTYGATYARLSYNSAVRSKGPSSYRPTPRGTWRVRFRFGDSNHSAADSYSRNFTVR
ncbi:MAG: hypothetical protein C4521_13725 [Actinobacteria bacterium]|nr:MAG: hypothetical protein C4521_13725 [Actinomycetota bacterium]